MKRSAWSGVPLASALAVLGAGCAHAPPAQEPRDPQAAYEPPSQPGDGQAFLARMAGEWSVVKTFWPRSGEPAVTEGTCRQAMIQGGRFLESDFELSRDGTTTTGKGIIGCDPASGEFTSFWIDSRSTRISIRHSRGPFDGERIVLYSASLGSETSTRRSRTETVLGEGGDSVLHRQYAVAPGGSERLMMELRMTRRRR